MFFFILNFSFICIASLHIFTVCTMISCHSANFTSSHILFDLEIFLIYKLYRNYVKIIQLFVCFYVLYNEILQSQVVRLVIALMFMYVTTAQTFPQCFQILLMLHGCISFVRNVCFYCKIIKFLYSKRNDSSFVFRLHYGNRNSMRKCSRPICNYSLLLENSWSFSYNTVKAL